jgi:hypothetical protein
MESRAREGKGALLRAVPTLRDFHTTGTRSNGEWMTDRPMATIMMSRSRQLIAALFGMLLCVSTASPQAPKSSVGRIVGNIDGISHDGEQFFIAGWACQQGRAESIQLHVFAGADPAKKVFLTAHKANFYSEAAVNQACQDRQGGKHRFLVALPFGYGFDSKFFVHGIRVVDGVANEAIAGSGMALRRLDMPQLPFPAATVPANAGSYRPLAEHPRVFTTAAEIKDLVARINRPASYSAKRFAQLASQIAHDLAAPSDWDATYSGCFIGPYLYAFSYEPQDGHDAETHAALKLDPNTRAPAGGAVVASRLALYATLVKAGAVAPHGAPNPDQAAALAKRILLAWADHGFPRDTQGHFRPLSGLSCDKDGKNELYSGSAVALHLGRGVFYSVDAQDLLQSIGSLSASEEARLNAMHQNLFDLIREGVNQSLGSPQPECQRYANGTAGALAALLAVARLFDDPHRFNAVLLGNERSIPVGIPWTRFFDGAIYGEADHPMECYLNTGPDGLHSGTGFTTSIVAAGEVQDRYRAGVLQTFGYPMGTLKALIIAAESLRIAGFDPYAYRGNHKQSIEMALQYYACYGKNPGFYKTVSRENARACPNFEQYYGKVVNGVDPNLVIGAFRFPHNAAIGAVEAAAKEASSSGVFSLDAILFGKWTD